MKLLNRSGAEVMKKYNIRGATDITGYGLAGHALKMAKAGNVSIELNMRKVPLIANTYLIIDEGCIPGASFRNLEYVENDSHFADDLEYNLKMIACDAQTSGGLLMSVPQKKVEAVLAGLHATGLTESEIIGKVNKAGEKFLYLYN